MTRRVASVRDGTISDDVISDDNISDRSARPRQRGEAFPEWKGGAFLSYGDDRVGKLTADNREANGDGHDDASDDG
jgi:hypothetical protein